MKLLTAAYQKYQLNVANISKKNILREMPGIQFTGIRASESFQRKMTWSKKSCFYAINKKVSYMMPIIFFTRDDVTSYCEKYKLKIPIQYHLGWSRTGCWACGCGAGFERPNTYQLLRIWYPRLWRGVMEKWGFKRACEAVFIPTGTELDQSLINQYRTEKLENLNDRRYKKEISALIAKAEIEEK
jgi:3'-phosphoadenosine 5'-phosphosulfate sulfotransferase (PAPS reductase)/FAD synthetase